MAIFLIGLIWVSIGGIALAFYLWRREQSRRDVLERVIGTTDVPSARHKILLPSAKADPDSLKGRVLSKAPSVWAKDAGIQQLLIHAGYDSPQAPLVYSLLRLVAIVVFPLVTLAAFPEASGFQRIMYLILAGFVGLLLPVWYLHRTVRLHQTKIRRSLPDALDLLVVCVEAGISLDAAILRVAKDMMLVHPELARELLIVNRKSNAGVRREEALRGMWDRTGVEEIRTLVSSLIQSEKWGTSNSRVLRISSDTLRRQRRQSAERRAATAPTKMVIPLALLIFPALFVVIMGPAALNIIAGFGGQ
ncbi:MAG TPA: type II secretion system F family protein [Gemmatimonadaceae bacterium]|nr:type II secretion system F family protein [Gemmatimonadaceae bacterium]